MYNMDESQKLCAAKEAKQKRTLLYDCTRMKFKNMQN